MDLFLGFVLGSFLGIGRNEPDFFSNLQIQSVGELFVFYEQFLDVFSSLTQAFALVGIPCASLFDQALF